MKWFIDPAEVREVIEKSKEIRKGIEQLQVIRSAWEGGLEALHKALGIDRSFTISFAVVSANSIGRSEVQDANTPVINEDHLVDRLRASTNLKAVVDWLIRREYLPVENRDYQLVRRPVAVGGWTMEWYSLNIL